jgi:hypothetical protein
MEKEVIYFEKPGKDNTAACLESVKKAVERDGYKNIVVASTTGETGLMFSEAFKDTLDVAFSKKFSGSYLTQIVANSLRRFGEGSKVCCECVMMAVDAGIIPEEEEVLAVAGTARGADTVAVLRSAATKRFLDLKVLEFVAKPRT